MADILPFIINNVLSGMINVGQGNNNIGNILGGMLGNQQNNINQFYNNQGNSNDIISILSGIVDHSNNNMNRIFNNQGNNNNIINMLDGIIGNQGNINIYGMLNNQENNITRSNKRNNNNDIKSIINDQKNSKNNKKNKNRKNNVANEFTNTFNELFNQTFAAVINNQDIIENIVDTVLNSDLVEGMINEIEKLDGFNIELKNYDDKYLIEGKLPGVSKKDIDLDYYEDTLIVKVKSNQFFTNGKNKMVAIIQPNSDIEKKFIVKDVDINRISAVFKSDILRVCLPKKKSESDSVTIIDVDNYISE